MKDCNENVKLLRWEDAADYGVSREDFLNASGEAETVSVEALLNYLNYKCIKIDTVAASLGITLEN